MEYDVFISHASEDKDGFVSELAERLRQVGLAVWYDAFSLHLGDSLAESISRGLATANYAVVIVSQYFIKKTWPQRELAALIAREDGGDKVILPVWHGVSKQDVLDHFPLLADRLAIDSNLGVEMVAQRILETVSPKRVAEVMYGRGRDAESRGDRATAIRSYVDTLRIDVNHAGALRRVVALQNPFALRLLRGLTLWFNRKKGFGFIKGEDNVQYFIHIATLERGGELIEEGDEVVFVSADKTAIAVINLSAHG